MDKNKVRKTVLLFLLIPSLFLISYRFNYSTLFNGKSVYVDSESGQFKNFPAAPLTGSDTDKEDISVLKKWQSQRSEPECARARAEAKGNFNVLLGSVSPFPKLIPEEATAFFHKIQSDSDYSVGSVKSRYKRLRPYQRGIGFEPCIDKPAGYSYPSGHAANARLFALILSDLVPEKRDVYMARADEAALDRVISGVHHPSDIEAGKILADSIYAEMKKNPVFVRDRDSLKKLLN